MNIGFGNRDRRASRVSCSACFLRITSGKAAKSSSISWKATILPGIPFQPLTFDLLFPEFDALEYQSLSPDLNQASVAVWSVAASAMRSPQSQHLLHAVVTAVGHKHTSHVCPICRQVFYYHGANAVRTADECHLACKFLNSHISAPMTYLSV